MSELWGHPDWRWALFAGPALVLALLVFGELRRRALVRKAGDVALVRKLMDTLSPERRLFKHFLVFLGLCLVIAAAVRPQYGRQSMALRQSGIDVAIAFDISKSMLARDVQPSRLEAARTELDVLLNTLSGHRMALVPFAGVAFTQSPLTHDRSAMRLYLDSLDPQQMPVGGTNLAMAIDQGVKLLTGEGDRGEKSSRSQVILLITDGEDAGTDGGAAAKEAAKRAAEAGVKVFAVAVGTRLGEPIPILNADGTHAGYQKDRAGKPVYSKLNDTLLNELVRLADPSAANETRVLNLDGSASVAPQLSQALDALQRSALEGSIRHQKGEKFQYVLLPALLLLLLEMVLSERRKRVVLAAAKSPAKPVVSAPPEAPLPPRRGAMPGDRLGRRAARGEGEGAA